MPAPDTRLRRSSRRGGIVGAAALLFAPGAAFAAPAAAAPAPSAVMADLRVRLPRQDLAGALDALSRASGVAILYDPALVRGRRSPAVSGRMSPLQAARRLTAGSGLELAAAGGGLVLRAARPKAEAAPPAPVLAVPDPPQVFEVEAVEVVGFAAGLDRAAAIRRAAPNLIEAVGADDLGRLPSHNLAESLSRLPGVSAVRHPTTGEGDRITVRGLSTELSGYALNGMRVSGVGSPGEHFYRGLRLGHLPPDGAAYITVAKTLTPDMDGEAVGGLVDIRTPTAFDAPEDETRLVAGTGVLDKFDRPGAVMGAATLSRLLPGGWGLYLGASGSRRGSRFEQNGVDGENQPPTWFADSETLGWNPDDFVMRGMNLAYGSTDVRRAGLNVSIDRRDAAHELHLRGNIARYRLDEVVDRLNFRNDSGALSSRLEQQDPSATGLPQPQDMVVGRDPELGRIYAYSPADIRDRDGDGLITDADRGAASLYSLVGESGVWDPQGFRLRRYWEATRGGGALATLNLGGTSSNGDLTAGYDLAWSRSRDDVDERLQLGFRGDKYGWLGNAGVGVDAPDDPRFPYWRLNAAGLEAVHDLAQYRQGELTAEYAHARETLWQLKGRLEWRPRSSWLETVEGGLAIHRSDRSVREGERFVLTAVGSLDTLSPFLGSPVDSLFGGRYAGAHRLGAVFDADALRAEIARAQADGGDGLFIAGKAAGPTLDLGLVETVLAGYAMGTVRFGPARLTGGLRVEHTGNRVRRRVVASDGESRPESVRSAYVDLLPSLHLDYEPSAQWRVRSAVWTSLSRPDVGRLGGERRDVRPGETTGLAADQPIVRSGNPGLKPTRAVNLDLSVERLAGRSGGYRAALFYKALENYRFRASSSNVRDGDLIAVATSDGEVTLVPSQGGSARIYGLELSAQRTFEGLPAPFDGLGASANLTLQRSSAETGLPWREGQRVAMTEAPETVANLQLFWTRDGWEAYLAWSRQSRLLDSLQDFGNDPHEQAYAFVDLTLRRRLNANLVASIEAQNLFDSHTYWLSVSDDRSASRDYIRNGRSLTASLTAAF